jgi:glycerophosphoryl diester phosphodiesterase
MAADAYRRTLLQAVWRDFRANWQPLALTDIAYKVLAFVALTPLVSILFRGLLATAGNAVLSDLDIVFFLMRPQGLLVFIVVAALWLGLVALQQASLLGLLGARCAQQQRLGVLGALRFAAAQAWPVLRVTTRIVAYTLLALAPFVLIAAGVYLWLLTKYDINFYLQERPPEFLSALAIGGVLLVLLAVVLGWLATHWILALPLVLFENVRSAEALRISRRRVQGHRLNLLGGLLAWGLGFFALSSIATGLVALLGNVLLPRVSGSLQLLAVVVGLIMFLGAAVNLAVNLLGATTFATLLFNIYRRTVTDEVTTLARFDDIAHVADGMRMRITRRRLAIGAVIGVAAAALVGGSALHGVHIEDRVLIMAHRGASLAAPENTLAAIREAIAAGADWVEIDVQETADGEVVVFHDSDFMKLAGVDLKIWNATRADLQQIDIGSWFGSEFHAERVPTLGEVLDECRGKIGVLVELKYYGHEQQLEERVAKIVEAHAMADEVKLMSLKSAGVRKMKAIRPQWKVGLLMSVFAGNLSKVEADFLAVNASFKNPAFISTAHQSGREVYVWTVNDPATMSVMMSRGVDGILTDDPALARRVLAERAEMSAPQRLLLEIATLLGTPPQWTQQ